MLYDWAARPISESSPKPPPEGRLVRLEPSDRYETERSRNITPTTLDAIFTDANHGDPRAQAKLAAEILEKDWDAAQALQTRRAAVLGLPFSVIPTRGNDKNPEAVRIASEINQTLNPDIVSDAIQNMLMGLLAGYSVQELFWGSGGATLQDVAVVPSSFVSFDSDRNPILISNNHPQGRPLVPFKFAFHVHQAISGDSSRGALIRPLGWMYLFQNSVVKDVMRFVEKFGMPFVAARVDNSAWEQDRSKIAYLIRNFGSDGGAVFSKAVELQFLDAAQSGGDIYFKLLDYFGAAKTKCILGQTATSGDASGFSKGQAQENVRDDILRADVSAICRTFRDQILAPLTMFRFGPNAPVPQLVLEIKESVDYEQKSRTVLNLSQAGFVADPEQLSSEFGMKLQYRPPVPASGVLPLSDRKAAESLAGSAIEANESIAKSAVRQIVSDGDLMNAWQGPVVEAIAEALSGLPDENPTSDDIAAFQGRLRGLLDAIPGLLDKMDTAALEQQLTEAMFAADANGRITAAAKLPQKA